MPNRDKGNKMKIALLGSDRELFHKISNHLKYSYTGMPAEHNVINFRTPYSYNAIKDENFDWLISVLYDKKIPKEIYSKAKYGAINVHTGLLPRHRGRYGPARAIEAGDREYGATIHMIEKDFDTGDIVATRSFLISDTDTCYEVYQKSCDTALELFIDILPKLRNRQILPIPQSNDAVLPDIDMGNKNIAGLEFDNGDFWRFVRAREFPGYEPAYMFFGTKKYYLSTKWEKKP